MVPAEVVHAVLDEHGRNSQRIRSFPAVAGVYYCMALSLYPEAAYEEVFAVVAQGLAWASGAAEPALVAQVLHQRAAQPHRRGTAGATWCSAAACRWPTSAVHPAGVLRRPATGGHRRQQLRAARRGGQRRRRSATPAAAPGPACRLPAGALRRAGRVRHARHPGRQPRARTAAGEWALCEPLLPRLQPGMLCLADRGFNGFEHWRRRQRHRRASAVALRGQPAAAGAAGAGRRLLPQHHPTHAA